MPLSDIANVVIYPGWFPVPPTDAEQAARQFQARWEGQKWDADAQHVFEEDARRLTAQWPLGVVLHPQPYGLPPNITLVLL